jgi:hypothetical protein
LSNVVEFETRVEKIGGLMGQIAAFEQQRDAVIAAAPDDALLEVHERLGREMAAGTISLHHAGVLQALFCEITRRGLNVVAMQRRGGKA